MTHWHTLRSAFRALIAVSALGLGTTDAASQATPSPSGCVTCHLTLPDSALAGPARAYQDDVHAAKGFGCVDCHGGDPTRNDLSAKAPGRGYIGRPAGRQILQACGRCHSDAAFMRRFNPTLRVDQVTEYSSSVHGQRLLKGDPKVATCSSCHPAHQILPPGDTRSSVNPLNVAQTCGQCHASAEYMQSYGIATDQFDGYRKSVHWRALSEGGDRSAPTCNDCHGNHGAAPPGVASVANVCGQCHSVMAEYYANSRHAAAFEEMAVAGCVGCHSNHEVAVPTDTALSVAEGSICGQCHSEGDDGALMAAAMRGAIDSLHRGIFTAESLLTVAERAGMEVSQAQFELESATSALLQARAAIHTFEPDSVNQHAGAGWEIATAAISRGHAALENLRFRRVGLGISTGIILLLIFGLVLKIRQIEAAGTADAGTPSTTGGRE
ncbi:MAG TPA: cytochrome c3 family protein [Gemmatimonadales bacterium]